MSEHFNISMVYREKEQNFDAEFLPTTYSYRIRVLVGEQAIFFEPDEERKFRAVIGYDDALLGHNPDKALIEAIANELILLFKD